MAGFTMIKATTAQRKAVMEQRRELKKKAKLDWKAGRKAGVSAGWGQYWRKAKTMAAAPVQTNTYNTQPKPFEAYPYPFGSVALSGLEGLDEGILASAGGLLDTIRNIGSSVGTKITEVLKSGLKTVGGTIVGAAGKVVGTAAQAYGIPTPEKIATMAQAASEGKSVAQVEEEKATSDSRMALLKKLLLLGVGVYLVKQAMSGKSYGGRRKSRKRR